MTAKELRASILDLAIRGKLIVSEGEWRTMKLSEACSSIVDCPHTTAPDQGEGYPLIRTSNVGFGKLLLDDVHRVSASVYKERVGRGVPEPGDLIFAREAPAGNIAVIAEGERVCLGQRTVLLKPKREVVDSKFLAYYVLSPSVQKVLVRKSIGSMVAHVNLAEIRPFQIQLPPLAEQKRIVEKIEQVMPLVERYGQAEEKRRQLITALPEALKKSILKSAVEGKLVPQDPNDEPAEKLLARIAAEKEKLIKSGKLKKDKNESVIFRGADRLAYETRDGETVCIEDELPFKIPKSWAWVRLGSICSFIHRGKSPQYSLVKKYPVVAQKCNQWSGFCIEKAQFIDPETISKYTQEQFLQNDDLLWNSTGLGTLGRMAMYATSLNPYKIAVADSHVTVIRVLKGFVDPRYIFAYLTSPSVQSTIEDKAEGSTKQKELATSAVISYLVPLPPHAEQKRIVAQIEKMLKASAALTM